MTAHAGGEAFHLDFRPGWQRMCLAPFDDEVWNDDVLGYLEWLVGRVLGGHRHRCRRYDQSLLVSIAPPDAAAKLRLLDDVLTGLLGATSANEPEDLAELN
jgi:hypothetical protein